MTAARIMELNRSLLSERDKEILHALLKCRYLTSGQIRRLYFTECKSQIAATRTTNLNLLRLQNYGVIASLGRRIGGVRAGSGALVRVLTEVGYLILHLNSDGKIPRKRFFEPSRVYLEHTLAVAESYVQIVEICKKRQLEHIRTDIEPSSWRRHIDEHGGVVHLKPDLFSVISNGEYEDSWFIEIDLDTASYTAISEKCRRYARYYRSGLEQVSTGVFPQVVWIVPNLARKEGLERIISNCRDLQPKNMFKVITSPEFETLLVNGVEPEDKGESSHE